MMNMRPVLLLVCAGILAVGLSSCDDTDTPIDTTTDITMESTEASTQDITAASDEIQTNPRDYTRRKQRN